MGWGDATCAGSELGVTDFPRKHLRPALLGQYPMETERLWNPAAYTRTTPKLFEHLRKKLGDDIGLLRDTHERITPAQAVELPKSLEPCKLFSLEDPLRPERLDHCPG